MYKKMLDFKKDLMKSPILKAKIRCPLCKGIRIIGNPIYSKQKNMLIDENGKNISLSNEQYLLSIGYNTLEKSPSHTITCPQCNGEGIIDINLSFLECIQIYKKQIIEILFDDIKEKLLSELNNKKEEKPF